MPAPVAILLAAGKGTRMQSDLPKVVHECAGRALVHHVLDAVERAGVERTVVVVGHGAEIVKRVIGDRPNVEFVMQAEQLGTGHAVMMAAEPLADHVGPVLVVAGDTPLLRSESLRGLLAEQRLHDAACVIGTADTPDNQGLGRIVRNVEGEFVAIVEQRDTTPEQAVITEINTGCYAFDAPALFDALTRVRPGNTQSEYYLTDAPAILLADGRRVVASLRFDIREAMGVNTPEQLAEVESLLASPRGE